MADSKTPFEGVPKTQELYGIISHITPSIFISPSLSENEQLHETGAKTTFLIKTYYPLYYPAAVLTE